MALHEEALSEDTGRIPTKVFRKRENNWIAVAICAGGLFINSYALSNVFPYMGPMMVHLGKVEHIDQAGYYVGFLGTAFMGARAFSSFFWGELSDRVGRKPILLLGCFSFAIFQIMLGFARSFEVVVAARLLMGFFNPLVGLCKTVVCEVVDDENQSKALSYLTGWAALGMVIGPTVGGWLSEPVEKFPQLQSTSSNSAEFFKMFPYVLPNFFGSFVSSLMFLAVVFFLPETCDIAAEQNNYSQISQIDKDKTDDQLESELTNTPEAVAAAVIEDIVINQNQQPITAWKSGTMKIGTIFSAIFPFRRMYEILSDPEKRMAAFVYSYYSFISIFYTDMVPLWYISTRDSKGISLTAANIGTMMSISGAGLFLYNGFLFPLISHMITPIRLIQLSLIIYAVFYAIEPFLSVLEPPGFQFMNDHAWFYLLMQLSNMVGMMLNSTVFVGINIIVNNACFSSERGAMNGLVLALGSIFKAVGPVAGAEVFAWSINSGNSFPFDYHFAFYSLSALCIALFFYSKYLPLSLNQKRT